MTHNQTLLRMAFVALRIARGKLKALGDDELSDYLKSVSDACILSVPMGKRFTHAELEGFERGKEK